MSKLHEALIMRLCRTFSNDDIQFILDQLDSVLVDYDIIEHNHSLTVTNESDYIKLFFKQKLLEGKSKNTIKTYKSHLKDFLMNIDKPIMTVTTRDIRYHLADAEQRLNYSKSTLEDRRSALSSFYKWLKEEHYIQENPVDPIHRIKFEKNKRKPYTQEQMEKIRYACRNNARNTALIEFLYSTGCRVSEVVSIKVDDVDWENGEVIVTGKGNKSRPVYLNVRAQLALKRYLKGRHNQTDYLFSSTRRLGNKPIDKSSLEKICKQMGYEAGINRKLRPHEVRHTFATDALEKGVPIEDVQVMLGHERMETTLIYTKINQNKVHLEHKKAF